MLKKNICQYPAFFSLIMGAPQHCLRVYTIVKNTFSSTIFKYCKYRYGTCTGIRIQNNVTKAFHYKNSCSISPVSIFHTDLFWFCVRLHYRYLKAGLTWSLAFDEWWKAVRMLCCWVQIPHPQHRLLWGRLTDYTALHITGIICIA